MSDCKVYLVNVVFEDDPFSRFKLNFQLNLICLISVFISRCSRIWKCLELKNNIKKQSIGFQIVLKRDVIKSNILREMRLEFFFYLKFVDERIFSKKFQFLKNV